MVTLLVSLTPCAEAKDRPCGRPSISGQDRERPRPPRSLPPAPTVSPLLPPPADGVAAESREAVEPRPWPEPCRVWPELLPPLVSPCGLKLEPLRVSRLVRHESKSRSNCCCRSRQ